MLKVLVIFLFFLLCFTSNFAQNSLGIFKIGSIVRIDKLMNISGKVTGSISQMSITGTMDMQEKKQYDVKVLEMDGASYSKLEVFVSEDAESQKVKMVVAGQPNNEDNNKSSPLKGLTIVCTKTNGTWEKSLLNIETPSEEQLNELNHFEIPIQNTIDYSRLPKNIKPGYIWKVKKEESAELFGNEDNPFKDGSMLLKLKKEIKNLDEVGYLWDATLTSNGTNVDNQGMNVKVSFKGTMLMTNRNFTMNLTGPVIIQNKQSDMKMTMKGPATLQWKKYQLK